jgi:AmmeMemoRadiSam system protein B/AmmeMemoRadiSam system protein A
MALVFDELDTQVCLLRDFFANTEHSTLNTRHVVISAFGLLWTLLVVFAAGCSPSNPEETVAPAPTAPAGPSLSRPAALEVEACLADKFEEVPPVRPLAGAWFPQRADELTAMVKGFLEKAKPRAMNGSMVALIAPHAGFVYSGPVAASAYRLLAGADFDTVLLVGPSHRYALDGISVVTAGSYATPLGAVPVDGAKARELITFHDRIRTVPKAHVKEHSLQNQLPFLQCVLRKFRIVPVLIGAATPDDYVILAEAIQWVFEDAGKKLLLVASTDLSHFPTQDDAETVDREMVDAFRTLNGRYIHARNSAILHRGVRGLDCAACGLDAVIPVIMAAKALGGNRLEVLDLRTSHDVTGKNPSRVVGYCACAILSSPSEGLTLETRKKLLDIARRTLEAVLAKKPIPDFEVEDETMLAHGGAFVTLTTKGRLRGCIGRYPSQDGKTPLYKVVSEMAEAAALRDYRFDGNHPATADLADLRIEISVLSLPRQVESETEIILGKHGVIIKKGARQGTYLPQVALDRPEWSREDFLQSLCTQKAGLPRNAWKTDPDVELWIYDAEVFHE